MFVPFRTNQISAAIAQETKPQRLPFSTRAVARSDLVVDPGPPDGVSVANVARWGGGTYAPHYGGIQILYAHTLDRTWWEFF